MRAAWLEWIAPWMTYRTEIEDVIDAGEQALVLSRDFGCREGSTHEVEISGSGVWTVHDGTIARAQFYPQRAEAFAAVGLEE